MKAFLAAASLLAVLVLPAPVSADMTQCIDPLDRGCVWWGWIEITVMADQFTARQLPSPDASGTPPLDATCTVTATEHSGIYVSTVKAICTPDPATLPQGTSGCRTLCAPVCYDPTVRIQLTGAAVYGNVNASASCSDVGITCFNHDSNAGGAPGCECAHPGGGVRTCSSVNASNCGGVPPRCDYGDAACTDTGASVDCMGTDDLIFQAPDLVCTGHVEHPEAVVGSWVVTCSGTDP